MYENMHMCELAIAITNALVFAEAFANANTEGKYAHNAEMQPRYVDCWIRVIGQTFVLLLRTLYSLKS